MKEFDPIDEIRAQLRKRGLSPDLATIKTHGHSSSVGEGPPSIIFTHGKQHSAEIPFDTASEIVQMKEKWGGDAEFWQEIENRGLSMRDDTTPHGPRS